MIYHHFADFCFKCSCQSCYINFWSQFAGGFPVTGDEQLQLSILGLLASALVFCLWDNRSASYPKENSFNLKFFWSMQILQNRYDFRHPRPTAPWAASRRPSAQNDRAPGSRSVAPDASVHGRFSVWFQCFNWSPCQGDVGYDFVCTCECRFTIIRSFWFNALHKLHGLNDFKLYPASSHIFIFLHALTSLDGTSMLLIVIHSDAGFFCYNHSGPKWVKSGRFYLLRSMPSKLCISIDLLQEMHICWYVELP